MPEFAFDVKLNAIVRVTAATEDDARRAMDDVLDAVTPLPDFIDGYNSVGWVRITEFSISDCGAVLFEVDGEGL